ncbi:diguanylate phosphodiesterase [Methylobacterium currus]|uniref:Diguanylate phosphodiesterase n=1 Tax=Methylobacterium currus TaxID=2051553 RepID=A0A2R4WIQ0_9HYPH|nr:EAL domain-containing protein [Methylobacterium currus]AWB21424.1 diguanylate phosphodiesterase [Methylobacterium currus]UHC13817.1 EAL domain-containing protein [Methylobacterium currus]
MPLRSVFGHHSGSASEQILSVLRAVRRHLAMDVGFISEFVAGDRVFRFTDAGTTHNPIAVGSHEPLEQSFCYYVAKGLMPGLMQDAAEDTLAAQLPVTHDLPVGAHLSVPLRRADGETYGTLCCFSFTPDRSLTTRDLGILRLCADVVESILWKDHDAAREREAKRRRIAGTIAAEAVEMVFQPIYRTADGSLAAFESLARFAPVPVKSPAGKGPAGIGPDVWFADAAEVGLGEELEFLAVRKALRALPALAPGIRLSLNLSPASLASPRLAEALAGIALDRVVIELTEHAAVASYEALREVLGPYRRQGLGLAIDDVGAGHATLRHVLDLSPEFIKLDMSLIRNIDAHSGRRALTEALTGYGRHIGCEIVAEGVETEAEYAVLKGIGVTRVQGFLTGRPMPLAAAAALPLSALEMQGTGA